MRERGWQANMIALGRTLCILGLILWATPVWFAVLMEILFRYGVGYKRRGKLRRMRMTEWLNATGCGMFAGTMMILLGKYLIRLQMGK